MYMCIDCGAIFQAPKQYVEKHGFDDGLYEHLTCCPICGGSYVTTSKCSICNEYITDKYVELDNAMRVCSNCYVEKDIAEDGVL